MFEQAVTCCFPASSSAPSASPMPTAFSRTKQTARKWKSSWLDLSRRLASTKHGGAWSVALAILDPERKGIREEYAEIKHNLRLVVGFFVHVMQALGREEFLAPGQRH